MSDYYDQTPEQRRQLRAQRNRRRQAQVRTQEDYHNTVRHVKITGVVNDILMGEMT